MQCFLTMDGNRKCAVFLFNLSSHYTVILLNLFSLVETISFKIWERPLSWRAKCSLPVAVRGSKTNNLSLVLRLMKTSWSEASH